MQKELSSESYGLSVTQRIQKVKQPRGGYLKPRSMLIEALGDGIEALNPYETTHAGLVGTTVEYLTRYLLGTPLEDVFQISIAGAKSINKIKKAENLISEIKGLDEKSIINAVKLCGFDVCYTVGIMGYTPVDYIKPDSAAIQNISTMVNRSLHFFSVYGPKVLDGFSFEGGYTDIVSSGFGDFTTKDTIWDFKVSKAPVKKEHTLQLLMYWRMGLHSIYPELWNIQYLGIYNPRLNTAYRIAVTDIPEDVIEEVEVSIIGYKKQ